MTHSGPLSKIRVLELGSTIAGPFCGRLLADFGAEVIKVEDPKGDVLRDFGKKYEGRSVYAASLLRNKLTVAVDLRTDEGRKVVKRLAQNVDVLIENFRPGTLEKWGLAYSDIQEFNEKIIIARISGFGQSGPYSQRAGYGIISEAMSGVRSITGDPDRPPARTAMPLTDYLTGIYAALGVLTAVIERADSGQGQVVDAALSESALSLMESFIPAYDKLGLIPKRQGPKMEGAVPNNLYVCADGEFVHIAAWADSVFRRLCDAIEKPGLSEDPRFRTLEARVGNEVELERIIAEWAVSKTHELVEEILLKAGVPASKIYDVEDLFRDPHYRYREAIVRVPSEDFGGDLALAGPVPKLSRTPGRISHVGHNLGEDTMKVLIEIGGYSVSDVETLAREGHVYIP